MLCLYLFCLTHGLLQDVRRLYMIMWSDSLSSGLWLMTVTAMWCLIYDGNRTIAYEPDGKVLSSSEDRTADWWCWGRWIISEGTVNPCQFSQETKTSTSPLTTDDCKVQYIRPVRCCLSLSVKDEFVVKVKHLHTILL